MISFKLLKQNPSLIPLVAVVAAGSALGTLYLVRLATKNPDVSWHRGNPEPWNEYEKKQYKFYSPSMDYSKYESPRPKF